MKWLIRIGTHLVACGIGFALGIYVLPILIAPASPGVEEVRSAAERSQFMAEFRRDLADSDRLVRVVRSVHNCSGISVESGPGWVSWSKAASDPFIILRHLTFLNRWIAISKPNRRLFTGGWHVIARIRLTLQLCLSY
jgi:hypothetical protein